MNQFKKIFLVIISIIYAVVVSSYVFFPKGELNQMLSTSIGFAQFYSFPVLFGSLIGCTLMVILIIVFCKSGFRLKRTTVNMALIFAVLVSFVFAYSETWRERTVVSNDSGEIL